MAYFPESEMMMMMMMKMLNDKHSGRKKTMKFKPGILFLALKGLMLVTPS
jgi:hypothetical protein